MTTTWTATSGALGSRIGSGTFNTTVSGSSDTQEWSYARTLSSGASYTGWTSKCIQLGKNGGVENLTLSTSNIPGTIKSVAVECASYQGKHNVSITVGETEYLGSTATSSWTTVENKSGTGTSSGTITISFTGGTRALYIKSITVVYNEDGAPDPVLESIEISGTPEKIVYEVGEEFDPTGLIATGYYDNSTSANLTSSVEWAYTPAGALTQGLTSVNVTATKGTVVGNKDVDITVNAAPTKSTLNFEEKYATGGATANDGAEWTVTSDGTESNFDATSGIHYGTKHAEVTYIQLATSDISGTISKVVVNARDAQAIATITVTVGGVAFTCSGSATATNTSANYTFTGSGSGEIVVKIDRSSSKTKAIYCKSIVVSYEADPTAPSVIIDPMEISLATPDAANGIIDATYENIDLENVSVGRYNDAECTEAFAADWLTATLNGDKDIEYTIAANTGAARTAYIKLTAPASNGTSPAVVKIIEVSQAKVIPTYTALNTIFDAADSDETVKIVFDNCIITGKKDANTAYLTDKENMYGLVIFTTDHGFNVGDVLNGTVQTTLCKFQGNSQLKGLNSISEGLTVTTGGSVTARVVSDPSTLTGAHAGSVIKVTGNCTKETKNEKDYYYINGVQLYNNLYTFETPTVNDQYNCAGVFLMYNAIKEIMPRNASDLEHIDVPTAVITFEDFNIEKGQNTTLAATVAPAVAASAEVTYSIVDGGEYVSLVGNELTANEIGIAHIRATVADGTGYNGNTKDITVTVTPPDSRYTAIIDGITAINGTLVTETAGAHKDKEYISYVAQKGNASNTPIIPSGKSFVRIYQNGGYLALNAVKGCLIDEVIVSIPTGCNSTTIAVGTDEENLSTTGGTAATAGNDFSTGTGLNSQNVYLVCRGTTSSTRLEVGAITVKYTGEPIEVSSIAVSGTYQTEFTKNATFNHDGVVVTATYTDDSHADVTALAEFSDPDMTTRGVKTVTVSYGGKSTTYDIEVVAATLTEIALSGTYPTRFHVGDAFSHTGMTVTASYSDYSEEDVTDDATFSGYDMSVGGTQTVTVEYGGQSAQYSIIVVPVNTDVITADVIGVEGTSYANWSDKTGFGTTSVYAGNSTNGTGVKAGAIQLRYDLTDDTKRAGIVLTTSNGLYLKGLSVTVKSGTNTLNIYAKNTPYTSHADLSSDDEATRGKLIGTVSATGEMTLEEGVSYDDNYQYIGMRSNSGALYLSSIMITWGDASVTPTKDVIRDGLSNGKWGTLCPKQTVENVEGATFYQISYLEEQGGLPYNVVFDEISGTTLTAGQPYFFIANATEIRGIKSGDAVTIGSSVNGFYGYISSTDALMELTNWHTDYDGTAEDNTFVIYNNSVFRINQGGTMLKSERCYININSTEPSRNIISPAPGRNRIRMSVQNTNVATGVDAINASETPMKLLINGELFILRGEKMYDAKGQLVK